MDDNSNDVSSYLECTCNQSLGVASTLSMRNDRYTNNIHEIPMGAPVFKPFKIAGQNSTRGEEQYSEEALLH